MRLWLQKNEKNYYNDKQVRNGLRLIFDKGVDPEVKRACKEFCMWLRKKYSFPVRVCIENRLNICNYKRTSINKV